MKIPVLAIFHDFTQDIMPLIESRYRIRPGGEHRAIAGLSMGGGHTWINWRNYLTEFAPLLFQ